MNLNKLQLGIKFSNVKGYPAGNMFITDLQVIANYQDIEVGAEIKIEDTSYHISSIKLIIHNKVFTPDDPSYYSVSTGNAYPYDTTLYVGLQ